MKLHTDGILRVERIDDGCLALVPDAYPGKVTALGSHAPPDDPLMTTEFARLAARSNACIGLDLPETAPPGILADIVMAAGDVVRSIGDESLTAYNGTKLAVLLAKLQPAGSPATSEPHAAPVSPPGDRYYLKASWQTDWEEVSREQFITAERNAGFYPKNGDPETLATSGFTASNIAGKIEFA